jgi:CelD/BcsL family acetyltransferase involved in cellulose biosynthesis
MMRRLNKEGALEFVRERKELFDAAALLNPFSCSAWVLHFIDQVAEDDWDFFIPECGIDGESLMLLYRDREAPSRLKALANYYSSLYAPVISPGADHTVAFAGLVQQLIETAPSRYSIVDLAPLEENDADLRALRTAFAEHRWYTKQYFCFGNWYLPCTGFSFEEYMARRPSQLYNTWLRKSKRFDRDGARLEIVTAPSEADGAMEAYQRVYAKSWKTPEPYPRFVGEWARICAGNGWLRLGIAWVGDVPIAAQFWFTMHRRAYIFKLAYDDEYSKWSAGTMLTAHMLKWSIEQDRVIEIDYLSGDDEYKKLWMTARRERVGIRACNLRSARGAVTAATEFAGSLRQRWRGAAKVADRRTSPRLVGQSRSSNALSK